MGDFRSVNWGPDEAKNDANLSGYFVKFSKFSSIESGDVRYVIGRKGAGKTAVTQQIRQRIEKSPLGFFSNLTLRDFPLQDFNDLRDRSHRDKSKFVSAWSFLLLVEISKLMQKDNGVYPSREAEELGEFLKENSLSDEVGFASTVTKLKNKNSKVKVSAKWIDIEDGRSASNQQTIIIHYQKVVNALLERISQIGSESEYWLFVDELDEGYRAGDSSIRLILLALFRAVEDVSLALNSAKFKFRPLVVLRSDIFDRLQDNDLNKLDDHTLRLRWTERDQNDAYALRAIPEARIRKSIPNSIGNPWGHVVENRDANLPHNVDTVWSYIVSHTQIRPRDIIKYLKSCRDHTPAGKLSYNSAHLASKTYSNWLYKELDDEIHSHLSCWREAVNCIAQIGVSNFSAKTFLDALQANRIIKKWTKDEGRDLEEIPRVLYEFGIVGNYDGRRLFFKYVDEDSDWSRSMNMVVHTGFCQKLRIKPSGLFL